LDDNTILNGIAMKDVFNLSVLKYYSIFQAKQLLFALIETTEVSRVSLTILL